LFLKKQMYFFFMPTEAVSVPKCDPQELWLHRSLAMSVVTILRTKLFWWISWLNICLNSSRNVAIVVSGLVP
jgi:hypothetical protein